MICDLAETYHILNYKEQSPLLIATLVAGLGGDSRLATKISGNKITQDQMIKAAIFDKLAFLAWAKTEDAAKGINRPESLVIRMNGQKEKSNAVAYENPAAYELARIKLLEKLGYQNGGKNGAGEGIRTDSAVG